MCVLMDPYSDKLVIPSCSSCSRCILILSGFLSEVAWIFIFSCQIYYVCNYFHCETFYKAFWQEQLKMGDIARGREAQDWGLEKILKLYTLCSYIRCHIWPIQKKMYREVNTAYKHKN